jgi:hypothetical protein
MSEYPKIETLFDRDPKTVKVDESKIRLPEFLMVSKWYVTEKIDGTNVRTDFKTKWEPTGKFLSPNQPVVQNAGRVVEVAGRTENAQMPPFLYRFLSDTFTLEKLQQTFPDLEPHITVTIYGEGYGPKIQSGGNYRKDIACRLFDVKVGSWWLEPDNIDSVARKLGIQTVPLISEAMTIEDAVAFVKNKPQSKVSMQEYEGICKDGKYPSIEGIVARTTPLLLRRNGERLMWKLKCKDFKL